MKIEKSRWQLHNINVWTHEIITGFDSIGVLIFKRYNKAFNHQINNQMMTVFVGSKIIPIPLPHFFTSLNYLQSQEPPFPDFYSTKRSCVTQFWPPTSLFFLS